MQSGRIRIYPKTRAAREMFVYHMRRDPYMYVTERLDRWKIRNPTTGIEFWVHPTNDPEWRVERQALILATISISKHIIIVNNSVECGGQTNVPQTNCYGIVHIYPHPMHNILSINQMASFNDNTFTSADTDDLQNEYFECLIECTTDNTHPSQCKRICSEMFQ